MHAIYLDNSATTPIREEVREAMLPYLAEGFGNPSSLHDYGRKAREAVETARQQVARLLNSQPSEVYFSPCATYSNNIALLGRAKHVETTGGGRHLITSAIEHPACLGPAKFLEANGWQVTYLPVDRNGLISAPQLAEALTSQTSIVSLMWANNEIGSVFPLAQLVAEVKKRSEDIFFHTDAVQVAGKLPIDVRNVPVDTLALSGHKFYAPKGIGVLYVRDGVQLEPIIHGGGQEHGLLPGTEAVPNIVAIGKAAQLAHEELHGVSARLKTMQQILRNEILAIEGARLTGPYDMEHRLPGHISAVIPGIEGEAAVLQCDLKSLCISSASACHKGTMQPSHVVSALGITSKLALGSLRLSAGRYNTDEECRQAGEILRKVVASLRKATALAK